MEKIKPPYYAANQFSHTSYDIPKDSIRKRLDLSTPQSLNNGDVEIRTVWAYIYEIHEDYIVLNCLLNNITQKRIVDKPLFSSNFDLVEGEGVEIIIRTSSNRREYFYRKNELSKNYFENTEDLFSKYKGSSLFPNI